MDTNHARRENVCLKFEGCTGHPRAIRKSESAATKYLVSTSAEKVNWMKLRSLRMAHDNRNRKGRR